MKNRIVYFHPKNDYTGSTRVLANILEAKKTNNRIFVVTENTEDGFLSSLDNVRILPLVIKGRFGFDSLTWRLSLIFWSLYCLFKFDTFYINTIQPYYAALIGSIFQKKIIYHVHEKYRVSTHTTRTAEKVFNSINCTKIFVSNYVKQQYLCNKDDTILIRYNKLSNDFLNKVHINPIENRGRKNILMISSLTRAKGVDVFVEISELMPDYHFNLILSTTQDKINEFFNYPLPHNIFILPKQSDVSSFLFETDLVLNLSNPSLWVETFGMTILEAMAFQIPAIVPNVGGPLELVDNGINGFTIDVTDRNLICTTIRKSLEEDTYRKLCNGTVLKYNALVNHE